MLRLSLVLSLLAAPAFGLSCKAPNFGEAFNRAAVAEEVYALVYGRFQEAGPIPEYVEGQPREVVLAFIGKQLGQGGFTETQTIPVIVRTECVSAWCGPIPPLGDQMLVFLEQVGGDNVLTSQACPSDTHINPSFGQLTAIKACMSALNCGPEEIEAFSHF